VTKAEEARVLAKWRNQVLAKRYGPRWFKRSAEDRAEDIRWNNHHKRQERLETEAKRTSWHTIELRRRALWTSVVLDKYPRDREAFYSKKEALECLIKAKHRLEGVCPVVLFGMDYRDLLDDRKDRFSAARKSEKWRASEKNRSRAEWKDDERVGTNEWSFYDEEVTPYGTCVRRLYRCPHKLRRLRQKFPEIARLHAKRRDLEEKYGPGIPPGVVRLKMKVDDFKRRINESQKSA
jgi:hypothetical protein